jgi:UDP-N-acetylmuramate dehydrogenase
MSLSWQRNRRLSEFSTFGIGGPISLFAVITTPEEMEEAFRFAKKENHPFFILGKGSNCLFDDAGFDGIVLLNRIDYFEWQEDLVRAGSGASFSLLGFKAASKGLKGLEFASGIPASVGGAVFMNAGANGQETCNCLEAVEFLDCEGNRHLFRKEELSFGYRTSPFQNMQGSILSATFRLEPDPKARQRQIEIIERRKQTQPLKEKSAGCVFRNPEPNCSAGALIDQSGLKGFSVGDAAVSDIHANFLINRGNASAEEMRSLIQIVQTKVYEKTGILLETEIRLVQP